MKILLNGEVEEGTEGQTLADLVARCAPPDRRVAVLYNGLVVPVDRRNSIRLGTDDRIELISLAPGG